MTIKFWKNEKNYMSHAKGLNKEQVEFLLQFKEGDKAVIFINEEDNTLSLKKSIFKANEEHAIHSAGQT